MPRYLYSGSAVHRATQCPASCVLPQVYEPSGPAAQAGTTVHRFVERAAHVGRDAALAEIPADAPGRDMCESLDLESLPFDYLAGECELPLAYDVATGRARELLYADGARVTAREYGKAVPPLKPTEIPMTLDYAHVSDGVIVCGDLKTGNPHDEYVPQVMLGVLALRSLWGGTAWRGALHYTRLGWTDWHAFGEDELDAFHETLFLAQAQALILRSRAVTAADVTPGDWCTWCRAKAACPASHEAAQALATTEPTDALATYRASLATPEGRGNAWARLPLIEQLVATMRAELDAAVIADGGVTPTGEQLGAVTTRGDRYVADIDAVASRLTSLGVDADAVMPTVTKRKAPVGAIEKAIGKERMRELESAGLVARAADSMKAGVVKAKRKVA